VHVVADLIDFSNHVIAHHERRPAPRRLWVQVAPDQHVGVLQARGKHVDPHLASAGRRYGSVDHLQSVGIAESADLNDTVPQLRHGRLDLQFSC
jgi:hypothetical protein